MNQIVMATFEGGMFRPDEPILLAPMPGCG